MLILIIAGGPDKGRIYELNDGEPIVLGREGDQVKLNDRKVSREHARLWSEGGQWYLEDLGSRHGTHRNHTRLDKNQRAKIKDGDYLQVGNTVMVLGRMPVDHAQKLALLGGMSDSAGPSRRSRLPMVAASVSIVALIGLGGYLGWRLETLSDQSVSPEAFAQLQRELVEAQRSQGDRIADTLNQQTRVSRQLMTSQQQLATSLDETHQAIGQHGSAVAQATDLIQGQTDPILAKLDAVSTKAARQQAALDRLGEMLAHQQANDNSPQLLAAMNQIKQALAEQDKADPDRGDVLLARLEEAMKTNARATGEVLRAALADHREAVNADAAATAKSNEALLSRVLDGLADVPTQAQIAEEVRLAFADRSAKNEQFMRLVLAEIRKTGDQIASDVTAASREDAGQANALMQQVVAELDKRPTGAQLASDLEAALEQTLAQRDTDESSDQADLSRLMKQVLGELEQRPTSEQLAADLRRVVGEDAQRTEALVARVMAELEQQPTARQIAEQLKSADTGSADKTAGLLEEVLAKVDKQSQLSEQITGLQKQIESLPGRNTQAVREVLARLDQQDQNSAAMLSAITELRAAMPKDVSGQLDQVLAQLESQVRTEQITDAIEKSMQRVASAKDTQTQETLAALTQRLDALPDADRLTEIADSQASLARLLDDSDAGESLGELRASLEQLSQKIGDQPGGQLEQITAMLEKREKVELMLAELHDAMKSRSSETASLRRDLLAAIREIDSPETSRTLRELMSVVQNRLATDESVRQAIRDEMRGTLLPSQMANTDARDITTNPAGTPSAGDDGPATEPGKRLSPIETAYKQAFETGQPMTVGAGVVDPQTGAVSKGRRIDPGVARQMGFETWRDWYLTDRHAQRMRLQQEAIRQRNANDAENNPGTIKLPGDGGNG